MGDKKKLFLDIGMAVAKTVVPGVAEVEEAVSRFRTGGDKRKAVLDATFNGLRVAEALSGREDLMDDPLMKAGMGLVNDGMALIQKAITLRELKHAGASEDLTE
jgi:hypothetical protein